MFHRESGIFKTTYGADMALYPLPIAKWTVIALALIFVVIIPLAVHEYYLSILNLIFIAIVGALGLNILLGYTGQISIGHGAFMSVGAYTAANLAVRLDLPFWITLPAGGLMAALIGVIVGMPSLRIKGLYLAIATLAGQLIIEWTINHVPAIAVSVAYRGREFDFTPAARFTRVLAPHVLSEGLPNGVMLNVNVPQDWNGEVRITRQSSKITRNVLQPGTDPRGRRYFWLSEQHFKDEIEPGTDHAAIRDGAVSITPLEIDQTHVPSLEDLAHWAKSLGEAARK